jgi:hypothetical protein
MMKYHILWKILLFVSHMITTKVKEIAEIDNNIYDFFYLCNYQPMDNDDRISPHKYYKYCNVLFLVVWRWSKYYKTSQLKFDFLLMMDTISANFHCPSHSSNNYLMECVIIMDPSNHWTPFELFLGQCVLKPALLQLYIYEIQLIWL